MGDSPRLPGSGLQELLEASNRAVAAGTAANNLVVPTEPSATSLATVEAEMEGKVANKGQGRDMARSGKGPPAGLEPNEARDVALYAHGKGLGLEGMGCGKPAMGSGQNDNAEAVYTTVEFGCTSKLSVTMVDALVQLNTLKDKVAEVQGQIRATHEASQAIRAVAAVSA